MRSQLSAIFAVLFSFASAILTILMIASLFHFSYYPLRLGQTGLLFRSTQGLLYFSLFDAGDWLPVNAPIVYHHSLLGLGLLKQSASHPAYTLHAPHLLLIALLLIHPYRFFRHTKIHLTRRHYRQSQNLCPTCAYNLQAHRPGQICPECGTPIQNP